MHKTVKRLSSNKALIKIIIIKEGDELKWKKLEKKNACSTNT
jgi:hypothetical protein